VPWPGIATDEPASAAVEPWNGAVMSEPHEDSIAIIGMAGRFPGAPDLHRFWHNLRAGQESISFFDESELEDQPLAPRQTHSPDFVPAGGVLPGAELFDNRFFGVSPREARWMDPQQRVFLEVAYAALEDAGHDPGRFGERISLYAGASASDHTARLLGDLTDDPASVYEALGSATAEQLATKVAFALGLRGEAITVHTACSTGLAVVHLACQSLLLGQSSVAVAGGIRVALPQRTGYVYQDGMILSPDGHCRAFDHKAAGTVSGNGVGVVVLRPLTDALADGDHIYAVIRGSAINNDGRRGVSYTAPSVAGQAEVVAEALAVAGVSGGEIGYVEAHGTGTPLGDPIEVAALTRAYRRTTDRVGDCPIGSVKSNIGHLDAAAGIAGLIKVALMLHHGEIPPSLNVEAPNPAIDFAGSPFHVNIELRSWKSNGAPRLAGVSSFGIGGTNVHAVLEEAPASAPRPVDPTAARPTHLVTLSAGSATALSTMAGELADHLERNPDLALADVAYTRALGRAQLSHRAAYPVADLSELVTALHRPVRPNPPAASEPRVAWLFPGQGSAWEGMAAELYRAEPGFRAELDHCLSELEPRLGRDLLPHLINGAGDPISDPAVAHPALFAVEYALARMWLSWGVRPVALLGHSFGEYAAACLAGVLSLPDAAELTVARGRLVSRMPQGEMLAVALDPQDLTAHLDSELSLAAVNGDGRCVVSGPPGAVAALRERLAADGVASVSLPVRHAFHSPAVEPLLPELREVAARCELAPATLPLVSSLTGAWWDAEGGSPDYWARQMREPVRFAAALDTLNAADPAPTLLVEVGPDQALTMTTRAGLRGRAEVLPSLRRSGTRESDHRVLLGTLGALWRAGVPVDWESFHRFCRGRRVPLPSYPFEGVDCGTPGALPTRREARAEAVAPEPARQDVEPPTTLAAVAHDAPRDDMERTIFAIWQERLGTEEFGIHDHFLELGGNSLMAAQMLTRLREAFPVTIPLTALFEAPTVAGLADRIRAMTGSVPEGSAAAELPPIQPVPRDGDGTVPLSVVQRRALALEAADPGNPALLMPVAVLLEGAVNLAALRHAISDVVARHETLRTSFGWDGQTWTTRVVPEPEITIEVETLDGSPAERESKALALARDDAARSVDLSRSPLRARLLRLADDRHVLLLTLHHVVADTWSMVNLLDELSAAYQDRLSGRTPDLPLIRVHYADFAAWQRDLIGSGALDGQRRHWRDRMAGATPLDLPTDRPRSAEHGFRGARTTVRLSAELSERVRAASQRLGVTPFVTLLAAYSALLGRVSGADDVVVGTPVGNRERDGLEPLIGYVAHALPLRTDLAGDPSFTDLVGRVRDVLLDAYQNADLPYEDLAAESDPGRAAPAADTRCRLFDAVFVLHSGIAGEQSSGGVRWRLWQVPDLPAQFGATLSTLSMMLGDGPDGFAGTLEYAAELFEPQTAARLVEQFQALLDDALGSPDTPLSRLRVGGAPPAAQPVTTEPPPGHLVGTGDRPDQPAVVTPDDVTTWRDLVADAQQVARLLGATVPKVGTALLVDLPLSARWLAVMIGAIEAGYPVVLPGGSAPAAGSVLPGGGLPVTIWRLSDGGSGEHVVDVAPHGHNGADAPGVPTGSEDARPLTDPDNPVFAEPAASDTGSGAGQPAWRTWSHRDVTRYLSGMDVSAPEFGNGALLVTETPSTARGVLDVLWALRNGRPVRLHVLPEPARIRWLPATRRDDRGMRFSLSYFANDETNLDGSKYRLLLDGARLADESGLCAVWTPERHFHSFGGLYPTPAVAGAGLATLTRRIGIRAGSVVLPLHDPIQVAEEWAVVDNLSGGRVGISFASGWNANDFVFAPDHYADRKRVMLEGIDLVRRLWRGESVRRRGGDGDEVEVFIRPRPVQPELPFWLTAAGAPATFRLAGELGGHVLTNLMGQTLDDLAEKIAIYRRAWRQAGHGPGDGHVTLMLHTFLAERTDEAYATAEGPLLRYFRSSVDISRGFAASQGLDVRLEDLSETDLDALLRHGLERYLHDGGLFGTPDTCAALVDRVRALGVDEIAALIDFGVPVDAALRGVELLGELAERERDRERVASDAAVARARTAVAALSATLREDPDTALLAGPDLVGWLAELAPDALAGRAVLVDAVPAVSDEVAGRLVDAGARPLLRHTVRGRAWVAPWARYGPAAGEVRVRPHPDARVRVVDAADRELGAGVVGSLVLGDSRVGDQRARWRGDGSLELLTPAPERAPRPVPVSRPATHPAATATDAVRPVGRDRPLPLSYAQQRLWSLEHLTPGNIAYNNPVALRMHGPLDVSALHRALQEVVHRHEVLRSTFPVTRDGAVQVIHPSLTVDLPVVDVAGDTADAVAAEVDRLAREHARHAFDLAAGPLLRAGLLRLPEDATGQHEHVLLINMHHIVSDGWSAGVVLTEVATLYVAFQADQPSPLPPLPIQFADYAVWQRAQDDSPQIRRELDYWTRTLADVPVLQLPTDRLRRPVQGTDGARRPIRIDRTLTDELHALCRATGVTPFMVLLAGFVTLLHRYSGQTDLAVGTAVAGRNRPEIEGLVGCFVNSVVVRTDAAGDPTFQSLLERVRDAALGAFAHQEIPFERLVDELGVPRDLSMSPLFQAMLVLHNTPNPRADLGGLTLETLEFDPGFAKLDLILEVREDQDGISGGFEYNTALFDAATVDQLARHLMHLLTDAVHHPDRRLSELALLSEAERDEVITLSQGVPLEVPGGPPPHTTVTAAFEAQVARTPDAVALGDPQRPVTFRELDTRANRLAHALRQRGVRPGVRVCLLFDRPTDAITAMVAVLKAGGAYVPLDPAAPRARHESLVSQAQPLLVVTTGTVAPTALAGVPVLNGDDLMADQPQTAPEPLAGPADPAYVIFTSGSTGRPKGVVVTQGSLLYTAWARYAYHGEPAGRCVTLYPLHFDGSVVWIYYVLLTGGTLWCPEPDPRQVADLIGAERVIRFGAVPALYAQLLAAADPVTLESLRTACIGGERMPPELTRAHFQTLPTVELHNDYGPTEATVFCTAYQVEAPPDGEVPIGRPLPEAWCLVLDGHGRLLPVGASGELHVGGPGVAQGYLGQPELTDERFVPDRVTGSGRLYRTGDLARWNRDGLLEYLGRMDRQLKIRGFRVEPGEVEAVIASHPAVAEAVVVPVTGRSARLAGYLAPKPGAHPDVANVRAFLQERLPDHLVPAHLVTLPTLPRTRNGKLDIAALPAPDTAAETTGTPPRTDLERTLADVLTDVLGRSDIGVHDGFFDLGGDSILAITLVTRLRERGIDLDVRTLFQHPTVAGMAAVAADRTDARTHDQTEADTARAAGTTAPGLPGGGPVDPNGPVPLTPPQQWFFDLDVPEPWHWNLAAQLELTAPVRPDLLGEAVAAALHHHDAAGLRFTERDGRWWQHHRPGQPAGLDRIDLSGVDQSRREAALAVEGERLQASLRLEEGPLVRVGLIEFGDVPQRLLVVANHLVTDAVSLRILVGDIFGAYRALTAGGSARLPANRTSYLDWAQRITRYAETEPAGEELEYWRGLPYHLATPLPTDGDGPNTEGAAVTVEASLGREQTRALLRDVPARLGADLESVVLTAVARAVADQAGATTSHVRLDVERHGREDLVPGVDLARAVGWFSDFHPVVLAVPDGAGPAERLAATARRLREVPHHGAGFLPLRFRRDQPLADVPAADITVNYLGQLDRALPPGAPARLVREIPGRLRAASATRPYPIEASAWVLAGRLSMAWVYAEGVHRRASIERLATNAVEDLRKLADEVSDRVRG